MVHKNADGGHPSCREKLRNLVRNGGLFLALVAITFYMLFQQHSLAQIADALTLVNPYLLLAGIGSMCVFVCCEACNISRCLRLFGYRTSYLRCVKYALIGFFFSSVTPSASGGQPMQLYYMHKDKIEMSHSALTLLIDLASYQTVTVLLALIGFAAQYELLSRTAGGIKYLLFAGVALNTVILALILIAFFSKELAMKLINGIARVLERLHYSKAQALHRKAMEQLQEYQDSARFFCSKKTAILKILMTSCIQIVALHSIPYWVYLSFGYRAYPAWAVIAMQAVLYITVSTLPLPGAVGVSESGFLLLFRTLFPAGILSSAMLLSRGISFYFFVLVSGLMVSLITLLKVKK